MGVADFILRDTDEPVVWAKLNLPRSQRFLVVGQGVRILGLGAGGVAKEFIEYAHAVARERTRVVAERKTFLRKLRCVRKF